MAGTKTLSLLGMAERAHKVVSGEFSTEKALKEGKALLAIIAGDASENTRKKFCDKAEFRHTPCIQYSNKAALGHAIGKEARSCAAVLDAGLAKAILNAFAAESETQNQEN